MQKYYRLILGAGSVFAEEAKRGDFIGVGWLPNINLTGRLPDDWKEFNREFRPIFLAENPNRTVIAAGLACGMLHTFAKGIQFGDIILSPDGSGSYLVGEVIGEYEYHPGQNLPHRRRVRWSNRVLPRSEMSQQLRNATGGIAALANVSPHAEELSRLTQLGPATVLSAATAEVEDPSLFALEKHLEEFLVANWHYTELGKDYDIFAEGEDVIGQQYPTGNGFIDILAQSKDKKVLMVVELKRGRATDVVVGQVLRYMGYVKTELAQQDQDVRGAIIAFDDDTKIHQALLMTRGIEFFTYKVNFKLNRRYPK